MEAYGQVIDARKAFEHVAAAARCRRQAEEEDWDLSERLLRFAADHDRRKVAEVVRLRIQGAAVGSRPLPPFAQPVGGGVRRAELCEREGH